jgi:hypothetical protein
MFTNIKIKLPTYIKRLVSLTDRSFIAGGAVRALYNKEPVSDIDMFCREPEAFGTLKEKLVEDGFEKQFENPMLARFIKKSKFTKNSLTVDAVVPRAAEFTVTYGAIDEVIENFDFTVSRAAILADNTFGQPNVLVDKDFEKDCKEKVLRIRHIVCPLGAVRRINKYVAKGYKISLTEIVKLFQEYRRRDMAELEALLGRNDLTEEEVARLLHFVYVD